MARARHPDKDIEAALKYSEGAEWRVEPGGSHAWGKMYCPRNSRDCRGGNFCITSIWGTPSSSTNHARQICRVVDNCTEKDDNE